MSDLTPPPPPGADDAAGGRPSPKDGAFGGVSPEAMAGAAGRAARLMRLMGHDGRLMVLCHLAQGDQTVGALCAKLDLSQSALSQHLARLRADGLVATRREGAHVHYSLASPEAARILHTLHDLYCRT